jgi:hypothetical protein
MSKVRLYGSTSGYVDLKAPDVANDVTITLPNASGPFALESYVDDEIAAIPQIAGIGSNVVSTTLTTPFSTTSASFTVVTGLDATITPSSNTAKVLVQVHLTGSQDTFTNNAMRYRITRDSTVIGVGTSVSSREPVTGSVTMPQQVSSASAREVISASMTFLDTPNSATAVTYRIEVRSPITQLIHINRSQADTDNADHVRSISTLTVTEVAA